MDKQELLQLVKNPGAVSSEHQVSLEKIQRHYPYFQAVRVLTAKLETSSKNIYTASTYVADRDLLRKIIQDNYNPNAIVADLSEALKEEDTNAFDKLQKAENQEDSTENVLEEESKLDLDYNEPSFAPINEVGEPKQSENKVITETIPLPSLSDLFPLNIDFGLDSETSYFDDILSKQSPLKPENQEIENLENVEFGKDSESSYFDDILSKQSPLKPENQEIENLENVEFGKDSESSYFDDILSKQSPLKPENQEIENLKNVEFGKDSETNYFDDILSKQSPLKPENQEIENLENVEFGKDSETNYFDDILSKQSPLKPENQEIEVSENIDFGKDSESSYFDDKLESNHSDSIQLTKTESSKSPNYDFAKEEVTRLRQAISEAHSQQKVIVIDDISADELDSLSDDLSFFDNIEDKEIFMETTNSQERWQALIDKFINEEPSIATQSKNQKLPENQHDLAQISTESRFFVSENLAMIYEKQGKVQRAIEIYEKLILKFPEKSSYFADRIEKLKS